MICFLWYWHTCSRQNYFQNYLATITAFISNNVFLGRKKLTNDHWKWIPNVFACMTLSILMTFQNVIEQAVLFTDLQASLTVTYRHWTRNWIPQILGFFVNFILLKRIYYFKIFSNCEFSARKKFFNIFQPVTFFSFLYKTFIYYIKGSIIYIYIYKKIKFSCKKWAGVVSYRGVAFASLMYRFCRSNALYSANLSFRMLPFLLTLFNTWYILYWAIILDQFSASCWL